MALIQNNGKPGYFTGLLILALVCSSRNSRKLKDHKNIGIYSTPFAGALEAFLLTLRTPC